MKDQELKKLRRSDLLELLIEQSKELEACKEKLRAAERALEDREIHIQQAGSIAEASLTLNGVFEAAQQACEQYTENIRRMNERQEALCAQMEEKSKAEAERILEDARREKERMESETEEKCREMKRQAQEESKKYWDEVHAKMEAFCEVHGELKDIFSTSANKETL